MELCELHHSSFGKSNETTRILLVVAMRSNWVKVLWDRLLLVGNYFWKCKDRARMNHIKSFCWFVHLLLRWLLVETLRVVHSVILFSHLSSYLLYCNLVRLTMLHLLLGQVVFYCGLLNSQKLLDGYLFLQDCLFVWSSDDVFCV